MAATDPHDRPPADQPADAVPWLDDREQAAWLAYLEGTVRFQERLDEELKAAFGLTLDDYEIFAFLSAEPEHRLRMSDIAARVLTSRSRLTYRIDRMEKAGWIVRIPCPDDGRAIWAQLTDEGRDLLERAAPLHVAGVRRFLIDHFDPDEWVRLGARLREVAEALRVEPPPQRSDR